MKKERETVSFADKEILLPPGYKHLKSYLQKFASDHQRYNANVFLMMGFEETRHNQTITRAIKDALQRYGLVGLRVDDREYAHTLWDNVCTYILGCRYGIAIFERTRTHSFNTNVAIELGFMLSRNKNLLILKDCQIPSLPSDLVGRLYRQFDPKRVGTTVHRQVSMWAKNLGVKKEEAVPPVLKSLTPRQEKIVRMFYGIGEKRRYTVVEIAAAFDVLPRTMRSLVKEAVAKLGEPGRVGFLLEELAAKR